LLGLRLILHFVISFIAGILFFSCETDDRFNTPLTIVTPLPDDEDSNDNPDDENTLETIQILSLGDSYTAGTGVCDTCSYPEQLKDSLLQNLNDVNAIKCVFEKGWKVKRFVLAACCNRAVTTSAAQNGPVQ